MSLSCVRIMNNLLLFKEVNKKSHDNVIREFLSINKCYIDDSILSLSNNESNITDIHSGFTTGEYAREQSKQLVYDISAKIRHMFKQFDLSLPIQHICITKLYAIKECDNMENRVQNKSIRKMYAEFDKSKPIRYIALQKPGMNLLDTSLPDNLRNEARKVLRKIGCKVGFIFGLDKGKNGVYHFHALIQGYLKPNRHVIWRYGWGYHIFPGDRNEYIEVDITNNSKEGITGFYATAKYCLEKHYPNKRSYIKI